MSALVKDVDPLDYADSFGFFEDFLGDTLSNHWITTATDSGTAAVGDTVAGVIQLVPSDGTVADNDETYIEWANEVFKFAADKPFDFRCRVQYTEANTDDANVMFGLMDAVAANSLQDNGAGPAASYSGALFFKVDGETKWRVESSIGASQTTHETDQTAGGASYREFEIRYRPISSTQGEVVFLIDGVQCRDNANTQKPAIKHLVTFASATEMTVVFGVKNGAANNEALNVDYAACRQKR